MNGRSVSNANVCVNITPIGLIDPIRSIEKVTLVEHAVVADLEIRRQCVKRTLAYPRVHVTAQVPVLRLVATEAVIELRAHLVPLAPDLRLEPEPGGMQFVGERIVGEAQVTMTRLVAQLLSDGFLNNSQAQRVLRLVTIHT